MRLAPLLCALVVAACGSASDPGQSSSALTAPPPADELPDGGTTPGGVPASDSDHLVAQLEWFATQSMSCKVSLDDDATTRSYDNVTMTLDSVGSLYTLHWSMTGSAGTGSVDTYSFGLNLGEYAMVTTMSSPIGFNLEYSGYLVGETQVLSLRETYQTGAQVPFVDLATASGETNYDVSCNSK